MQATALFFMLPFFNKYTVILFKRTEVIGLKYRDSGPFSLAFRNSIDH